MTLSNWVRNKANIKIIGQSPEQRTFGVNCNHMIDLDS